MWDRDLQQHAKQPGADLGTTAWLAGAAYTHAPLQGETVEGQCGSGDGFDVNAMQRQGKGNLASERCSVICVHHP